MSVVLELDVMLKVCNDIYTIYLGETPHEIIYTRN